LRNEGRDFLSRGEFEASLVVAVEFVKVEVDDLSDTSEVAITEDGLGGDDDVEVSREELSEGAVAEFAFFVSRDGVSGDVGVKKGGGKRLERSTAPDKDEGRPVALIMREEVKKEVGLLVIEDFVDRLRRSSHVEVESSEGEGGSRGSAS